MCNSNWSIPAWEDCTRSWYFKDKFLQSIHSNLNSWDASRMRHINPLILERRKQPREVKWWAWSHTAWQPRSFYAQILSPHTKQAASGVRTLIFDGIWSIFRDLHFWSLGQFSVEIGCQVRRGEGLRLLLNQAEISRCCGCMSFLHVCLLTLSNSPHAWLTVTTGMVGSCLLGMIFEALGKIPYSISAFPQRLMIIL